MLIETSTIDGDLPIKTHVHHALSNNSDDKSAQIRDSAQIRKSKSGTELSSCFLDSVAMTTTHVVAFMADCLESGKFYCRVTPSATSLIQAPGIRDIRNVTSNSC